jgi:hypothetical protein
MSKTRNNHYVPQWYQEGFLEPGQNTYAYLDLTPPPITLPDGRIVHAKSRFKSAPAQCFSARDLYSTFFGASVNDEIERRLFGAIDSKGANAVRAFIATDVHGWVEQFETFFTYVDAQRLRTPRGLDWLKAQYPSLDQNELMEEMQGVRLLNVTIWTGGVREIVSAAKSAVKFIVTDSPVTIYNYAAPPDQALCADPGDPSIALKGSQTIFPLDRDHCLILTNLEYAKDAAANPLEKRTFARNFNDTLVKTDALIRDRELTDDEVIRINYVLKRRARRYTAAGREEWLHPEKTVTASWAEIRETLRPPENKLWGFGGKILVRYEDGSVRGQDEFGRAEEPWDCLAKSVDEKSLRPGSTCGCGSGKAFKSCCKARPAHLRPTWTERSIRERNLFFQQALIKELGLDSGKDWVAVRRELTDEQIARIYSLFAVLWPRETDLLQLLPKPDGTARAVYTGPIHPATVADFALGAPLYFGEVLIEHPFLHARSVRDEFSPVEHPRQYRGEFLKSVLFLLLVMPLVEAGIVNLVPDPCTFDLHLRDQIMQMAQRRMAGVHIDPNKDPRLKELMREDTKRGTLALSPEGLKALARKSSPELEEEGLENVLKGFEILKERDPLAILQADTFGPGIEGGMMSLHKVAPNFEMAMYLAQATGAVIITDNRHRWDEIQRAIRWRLGTPSGVLPALSTKIEAAEFSFPREPTAILELAHAGFGYTGFMADAFRYAANVEKRGQKPNAEAGIAACFSRVHTPAQRTITKDGVEAIKGRLRCAIPWGGIRHNNVNRLLVMSSSEHHLSTVPMAFYFESLPPARESEYE